MYKSYVCYFYFVKVEIRSCGVGGLLSLITYGMMRILVWTNQAFEVGLIVLEIACQMLCVYSFCSC